MASREFEVTIGVLLSLLICFGMTGNIISFLVWTKGRRCKNLPGSIYLRALAITDSVVLCISAADDAAGLLFEVRPRNLNIVFCKIETTMLHVGLISSTWIVVCFTVDRTIAVCQLKRSASWMSKSTSIAVIVSLTVFSFVLNIPYAIGCKLFIKPGGQYKHTSVVTSNINTFSNNNITNETFEYCAADAGSFIRIHERGYHFWFLDFVLIFSVPTTIITVSNLTILCVLAFRQKDIQVKNGSRRNRNGLTVRALAVSFVHCASSAPFSIAVLVPGFVQNAFIRETGLYYYVGKIVGFCTFLNHSVNFILYSFFGTEFRRDTKELFGKRPTGVKPETSILRSSTRRPMAGDDRF